MWIYTQDGGFCPFETFLDKLISLKSSSCTFSSKVPVIFIVGNFKLKLKTNEIFCVGVPLNDYLQLLFVSSYFYFLLGIKRPLITHGLFYSLSFVYKNYPVNDAYSC